MDWIFWIRLIHTLVFLFASSCIAYIVFCGVTGRINRYLWASMGIVAGIGLIYAINGFECPLATAVHELAGRRDVSDIFFPDWFANRIMPISTVVYLAGATLVSRQLLHDRKVRKKTGKRA